MWGFELERDELLGFSKFNSGNGLVTTTFECELSLTGSHFTVEFLILLSRHL